MSGIYKLQEGYPIEYITHNKEFMKMNFYVDENVLIPRADTETLVSQIIENYTACNILDLCTGSGAIAISLAKYLPGSNVTASDISKKALEVAKKNAESNRVNINYIESDLFEKMENKRFDIIVSNPPYIETNTITKLQPDVQREPIIALDGGEDGLAFYRRIVLDAHRFLSKKRNFGIRNWL